MRFVMSTRKAMPVPPANRPMPTLWTDRVRGALESALDSESAISLACHVGTLFRDAANWSALVSGLDRRGFYLRFEDTRLVLVNRSTNASMCTCASLGHSFASLAERMGKPSVDAATARLIAR